MIANAFIYYAEKELKSIQRRKKRAITDQNFELGAFMRDVEKYLKRYIKRWENT